MQNVNFIFKDDLEKLTQSDMAKIERYFPELKKETNKKQWLYENRDEWKNVEPVRDYIFQKIYAGSCSIRFFQPVGVSREEIVEKLESNTFSFNKKNTEKVPGFSILCTFKLYNGDYLIRVRYSKGVKEKLESTFEDVIYVTVVFKTEYNIFQIRSDFKIAPKINHFLQQTLDKIKMKQINILDKYKTIEEFASAIKGTFQQVKANPALVVDNVSDNDWQSFVRLIQSINEFMENNEPSALLSTLETIKFETDLNFSQLILAGCREIGLTSENIDLSRQGIFSMIGENIIEHKGAIKIKPDGNSEAFTIYVSNDGGIQFKTSVDEKMIDYVFSYVLGENEALKEMNSSKEVLRLRKYVESCISNKSITGIRGMYLLKKYKLDEELLKRELDSYVSEGKLQIRYELRCCNHMDPLSSDSLENLMLSAQMKPCPACSSIFVDTQEVEQFIDKNSEKIHMIYSIVRDDNRTNTKINSFDYLEENLNLSYENEDSDIPAFKRFLKALLKR